MHGRGALVGPDVIPCGRASTTGPGPCSVGPCADPGAVAAIPQANTPSPTTVPRHPLRAMMIAPPILEERA